VGIFWSPPKNPFLSDPLFFSPSVSQDDNVLGFSNDRSKIFRYWKLAPFRRSRPWRAHAVPEDPFFTFDLLLLSKNFDHTERLNRSSGR